MAKLFGTLGVSLVHLPEGHTARARGYSTHMSAPPTAVFVYGTLMPGERNAHIARQGGSFSASPARLDNFRLFHLTPENYPGITPGTPADTVRGHLLSYAPNDWEKALPLLDALEGLHETPALYTREQVSVKLENGTSIPAWVYVYARAARLSAPGVQFSDTGDWRDIIEREKHGPDDR